MYCFIFLFMNISIMITIPRIRFIFLTHTQKFCFLQKSATGYFNHTPGQAPRPKEAELHNIVRN